jgi:hypothetical protein
MSFATVAFVGATIIAHVIAGVLFRMKIRVLPSPPPPLDVRLALTVTASLYVMWVAEFIYSNGIPFVEILSQRPYDYKIFGIPHLHVFVVTFSSFFAVLLFHRFLASGERSFLLLCIVNLLTAILIYNRGMFLFNLAGCAFLYMICRPMTVRKSLLAVVFSLVLLFLFGIMGSMRVSNESRVGYTNQGFLMSGGATESFQKSSIPPEYFWAYVYTTSPLANLQVNIGVAGEKTLSTRRAIDWIVNEVLPDFMSKRINRFTGVEQTKIRTIPGPFNATTVYAGSFNRMGWWGLVLMALVTLITPWLYLILISPQSPFFLSGFAILTTIFLFMIFDNTLRFTGFSLQLAYPFLMSAGFFRSRWLHAYLAK